MRKLTATLAFASLLALFHFVFVALPVITSNASGEGQGMTTLFLDYPLWMLVDHLPDRGQSLQNTKTSYILLVCIGGTLMYAGVGALLGLFIDSIRFGTRRA